MTRSALDVGSFVVGEVPAPVEYQYLDALGAPINLTGYGVVRFHWGPWIGGTPFTVVTTTNALLSDPAAGKVTYAWSGLEFSSPGRYAGQFFVNNGVNQFASELLEWQVCSAAGTPPTV